MGLLAPSLTLCQTTGPVLDPKAAFGSPGLELFEYVATFYLRVPDDVEVGSKVRILTAIAGVAGPY